MYHKKSYLLSLFIIGVLICLPARSMAVGVEAALGGWYQTPAGQFSYEGFSFDDVLDIKDDLNYDDTLGIFGRVKIDMPLFIPNVYIFGTQMKYDGNGQKAVDFEFGGETISGSVPFYSELKLNNFDVALYYGIPLLETATLNTFNIDIGLNVRIYDAQASIRQEATVINPTGISESVSEIVPLPMVYLAAQLRPLDWLHIEGEGRGIFYGGYDVYSLIGRVRFDVFGPVFAAGGYRFDKVKVDRDDFVIDADFSGPFLEVGVAF